MFGWYPLLSEEEMLQNLLVACDEHPDNEWWANLKVSAQERLDELYDIEYTLEFFTFLDEAQTQHDLFTAGHPI